MDETVIAIDGPAASGKSTIARRIAERTGGVYINTGDMYRALTWKLVREKIEVAAACRDVIREFLNRTTLEYSLDSAGTPRLFLDGEPVPHAEIRKAEIAAETGRAAADAEIRNWLTERQREMRKFGLIIMEGRDIGTVVFPTAKYKFFLTASPEERARRRLNQQGESPSSATIESVAADIAERDRRDETRQEAPLKAADDAVIIDSTGLRIEEVADKIMAVMNEDRF